MTTNDKAVDKLNRLIQANMDRKEGYQKAWDTLDDPSLKSSFEQYSKQSEQYIADLRLAVDSYGGVPDEKTTVGGDIHRAWMGVKDALSTNERKSVLESCEKGEDSALATYKDVMEAGDEIDNNMLGSLTLQRREIERAHDHIKHLRDSA